MRYSVAKFDRLGNNGNGKANEVFYYDNKKDFLEACDYQKIGAKVMVDKGRKATQCCVYYLDNETQVYID